MNDFCYVTQINKLCRSMNKIYNSFLKTLRPASLHHLIFLRELYEEPLNQSELSTRVGCDRSTTSRTCVLMARNNWIEITKKRRETNYSITNSGKQLVKKSDAIWIECERTVENVCEKESIGLQSLNKDIKALTKGLKEGSK